MESWTELMQLEENRATKASLGFSSPWGLVSLDPHVWIS